MGNNNNWKIIGAIFLLALILRVIYINQSLWLDEATTALVSSRSLSNYFTQFAPGDFHPPIYYLLSIVVARLFGNSEIALRSISLGASIISIYYVYKITFFLTENRTTSYISSLLVATSGLHIYYSQEARMYMLATLFATMSIYFYLQKKWKLFSISITIMVLTHYVTVFLLPVFWIKNFVSDKGQKYWKQFLSSHILLLLGFAIWFPLFYKQLTAGLGVEITTPLWWNILGKTTPKEILLIPAKFILGRITIENNTLYGLLTLLAGLVFGIVLIRPLFRLKTKLVKEKVFIAWIWLVIPFLLTAVMGIWIPVFSYVRLLFILPSFYILLADGISSVDKRKFTTILFTVLVINIFSSGVYLFNPRFHREDWKGLYQMVQRERADYDSKIVFVNNSQMEAYYYYAMRDYSSSIPTVEPITIDKLTENVNVVWLMRYVQPIFDPEDKVRKEVESLRYQKISEHDFNGIVVWRYEK